MENFSLKLPKIIFGLKTLNRIYEEIEKLDGKNLMIITDDVLVKTPLFMKVEKTLEKNGFKISIFKSEPEPKVESAEKIVKKMRQQTFDLVIGFGGGSCMDMAKITSVMYTNSGKVSKYLGTDLVQKSGLPKILVPTTAGTGSEVTPNAILTLSKKEQKTAMVSQYIVADVAIIDAETTLTKPPYLTATTGLDTLTHAIESFISIKSNPFSEALSKKAIELVSTYLYRAFQNGTDLSARSNMCLASLLAGIAISIAGVCAGHAAAYAFAIKYRFSHGLSCAIALPYILEYNADACIRKITSINNLLEEKKK